MNFRNRSHIVSPAATFTLLAFLPVEAPDFQFTQSLEGSGGAVLVGTAEIGPLLNGLQPWWWQAGGRPVAAGTTRVPQPSVLRLRVLTLFFVLFLLRVSQVSTLRLGLLTFLPVKAPDFQSGGAVLVGTAEIGPLLNGLQPWWWQPRVPVSRVLPTCSRTRIHFHRDPGRSPSSPKLPSWVRLQVSRLSTSIHSPWRKHRRTGKSRAGIHQCDFRGPRV
jgi:hypothetical protein